jgi:hypothetical protein
MSNDSEVLKSPPLDTIRHTGEGSDSAFAALMRRRQEVPGQSVLLRDQVDLCAGDACTATAMDRSVKER